MDRRVFLRGLAGAGATVSVGAGLASPLLLGGCGRATATMPSGAKASALAAAQVLLARDVHEVSVAFDPTSSGTPLSRSVLGTTVRWSDYDAALRLPDGGRGAALLAQARKLAPTVLRYPGGAQADLFHWESPGNENVFTGEMQATAMDTQAVLELCESLGAAPLFSANILTGDTAEAQRWIRQTNRARLVSRNTGLPLPRVMRWELGNKPYLRNASRPELDLTPAGYAAKLDAFIPALRAVDPGIRVGVALTTDQRNGIAVTPFPGFTRDVLGALRHDFDFACVRNASLPYASDGTTDETTLYYAAMAGAAAVSDDLAAMRALLAQLRPGRKIPLAITEWAPQFSLGQTTDTLILSPTAGLYAADLVRMLACQADLELADHVSLSGSGLFGAIGPTGAGRAVADALHLAGRALVGARLRVDVRSATIATPALGQVAARAALPLFEALPSRDGNTVRVLMINKDLARKALVTLDLGGATPSSASLAGLRSDDPFARGDVAGLMTPWMADPGVGSTMKISLPSHSVAVLELTMAG